MLTFCTNTRPRYFLGTVSPRTSTAIVHQLDKSVDNLWAHTLLFPQDYAQSSTAQHNLQALRQYRLGIREGGTGCFRLSDIIHSAYFSALAETIYWLKEHPIDLPWLQILLTDKLATLLTPTMVNLQQRTPNSNRVPSHNDSPKTTPPTQHTTDTSPILYHALASTSFPKTR